MHWELLESTIRPFQCHLSLLSHPQISYRCPFLFTFGQLSGIILEENATLGTSYAQSEHSNRQKETWALQMETGAESIRHCAAYTTKILIVNYQGSLVQAGMVQVEISSEAAWVQQIALVVQMAPVIQELEIKLSCTLNFLLTFQQSQIFHPKKSSSFNISLSVMSVLAHSPCSQAEYFLC